MKIILTFYLILFFVNIEAKNTSTEQKNVTACGINSKAKQLAKRVMESIGQQRKKLVCNQTLAKAAHKKAQMLAKANRISHNVNNTTPNQFLKEQGIDLPHAYEQLGNQVEAILGGEKTAEETFNIFMTSPPHRTHLLGENEFLQSQSQIGVGYFFDKSKKHEHYWVVYITALRDNQDLNDKSINLNLNFKTVLAFPTEQEKKDSARKKRLTHLGESLHLKKTVW